MDKQIKEALERIELQVKCNWWDNLMYMVIGAFLITVLLHTMIGMIHYTLMALLIILLFSIIIIQVCEHYQKKTIRRLYRQ